jgi:hypothetical protein
MLPRPLDSYATPAPVPYLINVPALGAQLALEPPSTAARMSSSRQRLRSGRHRSTGASSAAPQGGSITSLASSYYRPPPLRASFGRHPSLRESQVEDPSAHRRVKRRPSFSSAPSPQAPHYSRCPAGNDVAQSSRTVPARTTDSAFRDPSPSNDSGFLLQAKVGDASAPREPRSPSPVSSKPELGARPGAPGSAAPCAGIVCLPSHEPMALPSRAGKARGVATPPSSLRHTDRRRRQATPPRRPLSHPPSASASRFVYRPRRPTTTPLYPVVQHHLETFLATAGDEGPRGWGVPSWVERDFRAYLRCGILAHGSARIRCDACGHERLLALAC